jgi:MgtE intracellular N domain.
MTAVTNQLANEIWPPVREKIARALNPVDPAKESGDLQKIVTINADEHQRRVALADHVNHRLAEDPELRDALEKALSEIERTIINIDAPGGVVFVRAGNGVPGYLTLLAMDQKRAAEALEKMHPDEAIQRLYAMQTAGQTEAAARRLALMQPACAANLLSNMDTKLAAELLALMTPPYPVALFVRITYAQGAAVLMAMQESPQAVLRTQAVVRMAEIAQTDLDRAARILGEMDKSVAARLINAMGNARDAIDVLKWMAADRASAVLAVMDTEPAVKHLTKMDLDTAVSLISKMDNSSARELICAVPEPQSAELLTQLDTSKAAEVLAIVDRTWACDRLDKISPNHAVDLLVALKPPRALLQEIDEKLGAKLLRSAVTMLARLGADRALLDQANEEAKRIRNKAEEDARQIRLRAEAEKPAEPMPTTADRIFQYLQRHGRQTLNQLDTALDMPKETIQQELDRMVKANRVKKFIALGDRDRIPRYVAKRKD